MAAPSVGRAGAVLRRFWWIPSILVFLFVLYTAAGFWLVPRLARSYAMDYVEKTLKRHLALGEIAFNPFSFAAEIKALALSEADGAKIAGFDALHVDFEFSSFFGDAWTFKEVVFDRPDLSVLLNSDGTLNLAKLAPPADPKTAPAPQPAKVPGLRIGTFAVHQGRVGLEDRTRGMPFATTLTPIEFTLNDFRTAPNFQNRYQFEATTTAGERLTWAGAFSVQPFGSAGKFTLGAVKTGTIADYLQEALPFRLVSGSIDLEGQYRLTIADKMGVLLELPFLKAHDVGIAPRGVDGDTPWIVIPETSLSGIAVQIPEQSLTVERIDVDGAKVSLWREADGQPNLLKLLPATPADNAAPAAAPPPSDKPVFAITVGTIALKNAAIAAEDRVPRPATKLALAPLDVTISGYSSDPTVPLKIEASLGIGKGKIATQGDLTLAPLTTTMAVEVANLDLAPLRPYVNTLSGIQFLSGLVSAKTKIALNPAPARNRPGLQVTGDVTLANFATRDSGLRQEFAKWQQLQLSGIDFRQGPDSLSIDRVTARRPYGRVVISADQTISVVAAMQPPPGPRRNLFFVAPPTPPAVIAAARARTNTVAVNIATTGRPNPRAVRTLNPVRPAKPSGPMPVRIRQLVIEDGSADFADFSIQPNFAAAISALSGTVTGLSSDPTSRAQVKLTGSVDKYAPVDITGTVNLLSATAFTDLAMNFRNMELTTFNPYSGKYAGYNIVKGKLTTELRYKVDNRKLDAQHHVVLDQLEFGPATGSKDAVPIPIRLAVALLKDRNGVIDLNLPVTGSLDDPQFKVGPIIWQLFVGLITKIVEAPFALIGSLFGGGDELAFIDFAPGSAMLSAPELDKLGKLAKGLAERPELKLDIPLQTLSPADDGALADAAYGEAVAAVLPEGAMLTPAQRMAALAQLYEQKLGMKPAYPPPPMPVPAGFDATAANMAFLEAALKPKFGATQPAKDALARARAEAVRDAVLKQEGVAPERVFLAERVSDKSGPMAARMELNLQ